ncbi:hypothetical protein GCM10025865_03200 [Paraoerskovia sediminicola]|uniref:NAD(+) diphosphatase n=1 Tax=Paraoerskovia sediminicola TaxID=1138587 RepID=A0ABM8FZ36_9CELL|nr:NAD(+) diphosphatase [Paraoerskovia sediminicola]BDZ41021.1 hypothetical protein GCM10025865_03200 [Paraoerskovia sediminicola]
MTHDVDRADETRTPDRGGRRPTPLDGHEARPVTLDPAGDRRSAPGLLDDLWDDTATQVVLVDGGRLAVSSSGQDGALDLARFEPSAVPLPDGAIRAYLGRDVVRGVELVAVLLPPPADPGAQAQHDPRDPREASTFVGLRAASVSLSDVDGAAATAGVALAGWHASHPRCPRCGAPTEVTHAGWVRRCPVEGVDLYPRTDAAVIMTVTDAQDRLLLGHAARWPERRFSTLAGYVEPGESLESAVRREVLEEVGLTIGEVRYQGSQSWPFPASLMLGFAARATTTDVRVDGVEVTAARWFTRPGLAQAVGTGEVLLPGRSSIARALIEDWFGGSLPGE